MSEIDLINPQCLTWLNGPFIHLYNSSNDELGKCDRPKWMLSISQQWLHFTGIL